MKILENNYNETIKWTCPYCDSVLELDKDDVNKCSITCPCCNTTIPLVQSVTQNGIYTYSGEEKIIDVDKCENCGMAFTVNADNLDYREFGIAYAQCPWCYEDVIVNDNGKFDKELTRDNLEFPKHFWHTSSDNGAIHLRDKEVLKYINECAKYLDENPDCESWGIGSGDTRVVVSLSDIEDYYDVHVTQNFYETLIKK